MNSKKKPDADTDRGFDTGSVLIEEYKALWAYYMRTLDERGRIFDLFFKVVSVPFVLTGGIVLTLRTMMSGDAMSTAEIASGLDRIVFGAALFFVLSSTAGIACYVYYSIESANSRLYLRAMTAIRNRWRSDPLLAEVIVVDLIRPNRRYFGNLVVYSRGVVLALFNASMLASAIYFIIGDSYTIWVQSNLLLSLGIFVLAVIAQVSFGVFAMRFYASEEISEKIEAVIGEAAKQHRKRIASRLHSQTEETAA